MYLPRRSEKMLQRITIALSRLDHARCGRRRRMANQFTSPRNGGESVATQPLRRRFHAPATIIPGFPDACACRLCVCVRSSSEWRQPPPALPRPNNPVPDQPQIAPTRGESGPIPSILSARIGRQYFLTRDTRRGPRCVPHPCFLRTLAHPLAHRRPVLPARWHTSGAVRLAARPRSPSIRRDPSNHRITFRTCPSLLTSHRTTAPYPAL